MRWIAYSMTILGAAAWGFATYLGLGLTRYMWECPGHAPWARVLPLLLPLPSFAASVSLGLSALYFGQVRAAIKIAAISLALCVSLVASILVGFG